MSAIILTWSIGLAQAFLALAMACAVVRMLRGPRAQDRVVGMDALSVSTMLLVLTFGIRSGASLYFEAALVIALIGFVGTLALAKFLLRGEVIE
jgi:multicomponent K+:H+ antiporter subunit F